MSSSHDITLTPQEQALIMRLKSFRVPEMAHILEEQLKDPNADLNTFMERMTAMVIVSQNADFLRSWINYSRYQAVLLKKLITAGKFKALWNLTLHWNLNFQVSYKFITSSKVLHSNRPFFSHTYISY